VTRIDALIAIAFALHAGSASAGEETLSCESKDGSLLIEASGRDDKAATLVTLARDKARKKISLRRASVESVWLSLAADAKGAVGEGGENSPRVVIAPAGPAKLLWKDERATGGKPCLVDHEFQQKLRISEWRDEQLVSRVVLFSCHYYVASNCR
jgi:hypothetical protein